MVGRSVEDSTVRALIDITPQNKCRFILILEKYLSHIQIGTMDEWWSAFGGKMSSPILSRKFQDVFTFCDDDGWVWNWIRDTLKSRNIEFVKMHTLTPLRHSWDRFRSADYVIVHWEAQRRTGGAIVEEILESEPNFDVGERIIVISTNPTREDVVYFSELGLRKIVRLRNRDREIMQATQELTNHLRSNHMINPVEHAWRSVLRAIDILPTPPEGAHALRIEGALERLKAKDNRLTARYLDALANLRFKQDRLQEAQDLWMKALDLNSNYFRSYHGVIRLQRKMGQYDKAYALMQKLHALNRNHISRLTDMGEIQVKLGEETRAEHYFKTALDRDAHCSKALNGLAGIRFRAGALDESRKLLAKSRHAYEIARELNEHGISLVKQGKYKEALDHYTKAQYVIPHQDKGPMLFYNIGLCYSRWGKPDMAKEFLRIALIKEPTYDKALRLLRALEQRA
jgi:tetratricopeptide (TPR) repeat protein